VSDSHDDQGSARDEKSDRLDELFELVLGIAPVGVSVDQEFEQLRDALGEVRRYVGGLAAGDLRAELDVRGPIAGPLKSLGSSLKHMTWQAKEIAAGDLSQRIDFLGEFSTAFNEMAERLDITLGELRAREHDLSDANEELRAAHAQLLDQATHDPLTGLLNRRSLAERWAAEAARADRAGEPITVMIADLDKFKAINDTCGHEAGDIVLVSFAETASRLLRGSDIACRIGGDEFVLLLPGTAPQDGLEVANRIRDAFAGIDMGPSLDGTAHTASIGMAEYPANGNTLDAVLRAADEALYEVKARGRNQVVAATT
jgi:diguanylate cyclase (GGDEF)-like protein